MLLQALSKAASIIRNELVRPVKLHYTSSRPWLYNTRSVLVAASGSAYETLCARGQLQGCACLGARESQPASNARHGLQHFPNKPRQPALGVQHGLRLGMETYTRLADVTGQETQDDVFSPPFSSEYEYRKSTWSRVKLWWRVHVKGEPAEPVIPSGYLTLIPLNDARLKPQRRVYVYLFMVLFVLAAMAATFLLVPRGFSAGEIDIQADKMSWNVTKGTYQLKLLARIPIHNPNFLKATASGMLSVYFYDTLAGSQPLEPTTISARANPQVVEVNIDASDVPSEYALTILSECAAFPRRLVFFLKGTLSVKDHIQTINLAPIDTYFMLNCFNNTSGPGFLHRAPS